MKFINISHPEQKVAFPEAVVTGLTPTPRRSVVKLAATQQHFFTIASLLRDRGYHTSFIYGG